MSDTATGAASGAATGAALGPWGALAGGVIGAFGGMGGGSSAAPASVPQIQDQTFNYGSLSKGGVEPGTAIVISTVIIGGVIVYAISKR